MKKDRRDFIKLSGLAAMGLASPGFTSDFDPGKPDHISYSAKMSNKMTQKQNSAPNIIGPYGEWAAGLTEKDLPSLSYRRKEFPDIEQWRRKAKSRLAERLAIPDSGKMPEVTLVRQYTFDGLHIEELKWQLPYGRPTDAILLKPENAKGKLPAILGFHDHGGNKYFGTRKITKTSENQHPLMVEHQKNYYEGRAWANEIAKRGYVVLVPDAFPFASRRVMLQDVPEHLRGKLTDENPEDPKNIAAYNTWAANHEHIMAKSLFSAGTTWPGVFLSEDMKALDILASRNDVDSKRIGCAGLSGGGMRTVYSGGFDNRIKCAVCVGFMTTWRDFVLNKSFTHTWMTYVPILPNELDFPEILGLRVPNPTMVLNDSDDQLYTPAEMKRAENILSEIFKKAGASDKFKCSYYPGPHKFDKAMQEEAFAWFDKWLK
jgi:dienelactone hydrolase